MLFGLEAHKATSWDSSRKAPVVLCKLALALTNSPCDWGDNALASFKHCVVDSALYTNSKESLLVRVVAGRTERSFFNDEFNVLLDKGRFNTPATVAVDKVE